MNCWSKGSSSVAGGLSRNSLSLIIMLHTSIRNPATPRSHQKRTMSSNSRRTSSFHQFRSGCAVSKLCRKYWPLASSSSQAGPPKMLTQLLGGPPSGLGSAQT